jgi:hypothetical protein
MKLYELEKGTMFSVIGGQDVFQFDHIDGMFSVCYLGENTVYIAAFAEVVPHPEYNDE